MSDPPDSPSTRSASSAVLTRRPLAEFHAARGEACIVVFDDGTVKVVAPGLEVVLVKAPEA